LTPEDLVSRIRSGDSDTAISTFLDTNPDISPDVLAANALAWNLDDVTEAILRWVTEKHPDYWECRKQLGLFHLERNRFDTALEQFTALMEARPDDYIGYWGVCTAYSRQGDQKGLRRTIQKAQATMPEGTYVNWQDGALLRELPNDDAITRSKENFERRTAVERKRRIEQTQGAQAPQPAPPRPPAGPRSVETAAAVEIGNSGATLSGRLANVQPNSRYWFEYGPSPNHLSEKTELAPVPGPLNARLSVDPILSGLKGRYYASKLQWTDESADALVLASPFGKDANHISGIGFLDLVFGIWHNSNYPIGPQELSDWETTDLRDARIDLDLWTDQFDGKDFRYCIGVGNGETYWGLTGTQIDLNPAPETGSVSVSFRLSADPVNWTFFGSNSREQIDSADRYGYAPLDNALSMNRGNIVFAGMFGNWRDTPTGYLGLKQLTLTYRDRNLLHQDNGAELIASPLSLTRPICPPERLTDGCRGRLGDSWYFAGRSDGPLTFEWQLPVPEDIRTLVLHQDWVMPVASCRITLTADDGEAHSWDISLAAPTDPFNDPLINKLQLPGGKKFTNISLDLLSGHTPDGIALAAFEAFGEGSCSATDEPVSVTVSTDIGNLAEGTRVHYRLCHVDEETVIKGDIAELSLPDGSSPVIHDLSLGSSSATDRASIGVRANAMGFDAALEWRVNGDDSWQKIPMGWERTQVSRVIAPPPFPPGNHEVEVRATQDGRPSGPAKKLTFRIPS
tara:strand:- start:227 stop:2443 length:2217 start_codon:yes stop_codon:yes gene_type:complete